MRLLKNLSDLPCSQNRLKKSEPGLLVAPQNGTQPLCRPAAASAVRDLACWTVAASARHVHSTPTDQFLARTPALPDANARGWHQHTCSGGNQHVRGADILPADTQASCMHLLCWTALSHRATSSPAVAPSPEPSGSAAVLIKGHTARPTTTPLRLTAATSQLGRSCDF
jgi:hypothetical protein